VAWPSVAVVRKYLQAHLPPGETKVGGQDMLKDFLYVWRDLQHGKTPERLPPSVPDHHRVAIQDILSKVAQEVRDECSLDMVSQKAELANILEIANGLESEIDMLSDELEARTTERDALAGQHAMMSSELGEHKLLLSSAIGLQSGLQIEIAELRHREASLKVWQEEARGREADFREQVKELNSEISREREVRLEAQKRLDVLQIQLDSTNQALNAADARFAPLLALVEKIEPVAVRAAMAESRIPDLEAHIETLEGLFGSDRRAIKRLSRTRKGPQFGQKSRPAAS